MSYCSVCSPPDNTEFERAKQSALQYAKEKKVLTAVYNEYGEWRWCLAEQAFQLGYPNPHFFSAYS